MEWLTIEHLENEHPGYYLDAAIQYGVKLERIKVWQGQEIPKLEKRHSGLIIMGGSMGINDPIEEYPTRNIEIELVKAALDRDLLVFGTCLGAQVIASALGAEVYVNWDRGKNHKEVGYSQVDLTEEGKKDPLYKGFKSPITVLQWHGDAFDLPEGAVLLTTSPVCDNQSFKFGKRVYANLFHLEFTPKMVNNQIIFNKDWIQKDINTDEVELRREAYQHSRLMRGQAFGLFGNLREIAQAA